MIILKILVTPRDRVPHHPVPTRHVTATVVSHRSFPQDEFQSAETHFNDNLLHAVENAKLDRPIDSTPPLAHNTYVAQEADWGDQWGDYQAYQADEWDEQWYEEEDTHEYAMEHEEDQDEVYDEEVFATHEGTSTYEDTMEEGDTSGEEDEDGYE